MLFCLFKILYSINNISYNKKDMENKFKTLIILIISLFNLASCNNPYLSKPENTNLTYWITEKVNDEFRKQQRLYIEEDSMCFGCPSKYLDNAYKLNENGDLPEKYVLYTIYSYPDLIDEERIVGIKITDPEIYFYDISINSSIEFIEKKLTPLGFKKYISNDPNIEIRYRAKYFYNDAITFTFYDSMINLYASSTNKHNIEF